MRNLRITGGRVIDPSQRIDRIDDVWIGDGRVLSIGRHSQWDADQTIDANGKLVIPGLVDMHVHLREPGGSASETIETGTRAALESGITTVIAMPDTEPPIDNQASAEFVTLQARRARHVNVWPVGSVTKGREGNELAEMGGLVQGHAVAFGEGDRAVSNAEIMRRALQYAEMLGKPVLSYPNVPELTGHGMVNEGSVSVKLGMPGMPAVAELIMVDRDLHLARFTGARLHLQTLSCAGSVESVRRAKKEKVRVTAEVAIHHLCLTDQLLESFDSVYKVSPPLRTSDDVKALIEGLRDGTIDTIVSDHSPCSPEQKLRELDDAPFGMIGMESLLPVAIRCLIEPGLLSWPELIEKMSTNPARILGLDRGTLVPGAVADVVVLDPEVEWTIDPRQFRSRSRNCPFAGWKVRGRASTVIVEGKVRFVRE